MARIAKVKSVETAWELCDYLAKCIEGCTFQVQMPDRNSFEVWPFDTCPLRPAEQVLAQQCIVKFRERKIQQVARTGQRQSRNLPRLLNVEQGSVRTKYTDIAWVLRRRLLSPRLIRQFPRTLTHPVGFIAGLHRINESRPESRSRVSPAGFPR